MGLSATSILIASMLNFWVLIIMLRLCKLIFLFLGNAHTEVFRDSVPLNCSPKSGGGGVGRQGRKEKEGETGVGR